MKSVLLTILLISPIALGKAEKKPLHEKSFQEILKSYLFVNDFQTDGTDFKKLIKTDHLFWPYQYAVADITLLFDFDLESIDEIPVTKGEGRVMQHINGGRREFLLGNFRKARDTWLAARHHFGTSHPYHRRVDYFIALSQMQIAKENIIKGLSYTDTEVRTPMANATTFLSWAFVIKQDSPDELLDKVAPKQLYNLTAIYYSFKRYAEAFRAAGGALKYLRKAGKKRYRTLFRRVAAEAHIRNRTYLEAVKQLDLALRQDADREQAAAMFARVGDIYFALNKYELAEDAYALANRIDHENKAVSPSQFILRGESLFWMSRFDEALKNFHYAIETSVNENIRERIPPDYVAQAHLRVADAHLAMEDYDKARLFYYKVAREFRGHKVGEIAKVRSACLELPDFQGNNVMHARNTLEKMRKKPNRLPAEGIELAWACEVASYTQRERTESMTVRVREFYSQFPKSRFLKSLVEPVREVKADKVYDYFKKNQIYSAISYFENTRSLLYEKVPIPLQQRLFIAYVNTYDSAKSEEFWQAYDQVKESDIKIIRQTVAAIEIGRNDPKWLDRANRLGRSQLKRAWTIDAAEPQTGYLSRLLAQDNIDPVHHVWSYELSKSWDEKENLYFCSHSYPLLSSIYESGQYQDFVRKEIQAQTERQLPALLAKDEGCALSLLELEIESYKDDPIPLALKYIQRSDWPLSKPLTTIIWGVAERAAKVDRVQAKTLWQLIKDRAPAGSPEVVFANLRLDEEKTQYEGIW